MVVVTYFEQHLHPLWKEKVLGRPAGAPQEPWLPPDFWGPGGDGVPGSRCFSWPGRGATAPAIQLNSTGGTEANASPFCRSWEALPHTQRRDTAHRRWKPCLSPKRRTDRQRRDQNLAFLNYHFHPQAPFNH